MTVKFRSYLFLILAVGIFSAAFHGLGLTKLAPWHLVYSDTLGFFDRAVASGFPYISKLIEYPVLTGFFIQFSGFLGKSRFGYYLASVIGLIAAAAAVTYFMYQILPEPQRKKLLPYWIFAPSMIVFLTSNWDILAILLVVTALYFFHKQKFYWGTFFLSLGFSAKFYPILYFLPLLLSSGGGSASGGKKLRWKNRLAIIGILVATTAVLNGFFAYYYFDAWSYFYNLNAFRDPNPDSIWTIIRYFVWPFEVGTINWLSLILFGGSYFYLIYRYRRESLIKIFTIVTLLFVLYNKIFSPQYLLWLLPFFALYLPPPRKWFYLLEFSNLAAFFSILPWFFLDHDLFYFYLASPFVVIRHISLIVIFFYALKKPSAELPQINPRAKFGVCG